MKILITDDDLISRKVLQALLIELGHEVTISTNGMEGLELFSQNPTSIIISDWLMPGMDGLEFCQQIRAKQTTNYVYFILLTMKSSDKANYRQAMDAGVDDFLTKPLDSETIWLRLRVAERILEFAKQVYTLKNLLPICMYCKKIRDDQNYWQQIEIYISEHTGSNFSHGICPECIKRVKEELSLKPLLPLRKSPA